ncbi:MAG: hypothetical protein AABZ33_07640 [Chloroflexota bacterium]
MAGITEADARRAYEVLAWALNAGEIATAAFVPDPDDEEIHGRLGIQPGRFPESIVIGALEIDADSLVLFLRSTADHDIPIWMTRTAAGWRIVGRASLITVTLAALAQGGAFVPLIPIPPLPASRLQ